MFRKIMHYILAAVIIFFILSVVSVAKNWDVITNYFTNSLYSIGGLILYLAIYAIAFGLLLKAVFGRR